MKINPKKAFKQLNNKSLLGHEFHSPIQDFLKNKPLVRHRDLVKNVLYIVDKGRTYNGKYVELELENFRIPIREGFEKAIFVKYDVVGLWK